MCTSSIEVDLVAGEHRPVARALDDLAHVVDAGVGGGVHLQHVGVAPLHDLGAVAAELPAMSKVGLSTPSRCVVERRAPGCVPWWSCRRRARRSACSLARCGRWRTRSSASSPWRPGRSGRRRWRDGTCVPARRKACRRLRQPRRRSRPDRPVVFSGHAGLLRAPTPSPRRRGPKSPSFTELENLTVGSAVATSIRRRVFYTTRARRKWEADKRPASGSLGLLPSGPDPVGEGHVRRQPPAALSYEWPGDINPCAIVRHLLTECVAWARPLC